MSELEQKVTGRSEFHIPWLFLVVDPKKWILECKMATGVKAHSHSVYWMRKVDPDHH